MPSEKTTFSECDKHGHPKRDKPTWKNAAYGLICLGHPAAEVARLLGKHRHSIGRLVKRWLDEGRIEEDTSAPKISSYITGGRPPKTYAPKRECDKHGVGDVTNPPPQIIENSKNVPPEVWANGTHARPHNMTWWVRLAGAPARDPREWGLPVLREWSASGTAFCEVALGGEWLLRYNGGRKRWSVQLTAPGDVYVPLADLERYNAELRDVLWRVWQGVSARLGVSTGFPREPPDPHIAIPIADAGLAREAGLVYRDPETGEALMWVDYSKGYEEVEGVPPVMEGLAAVPDRLTLLEARQDAQEELLVKQLDASGKQLDATERQIALMEKSLDNGEPAQTDSRRDVT